MLLDVLKTVKHTCVMLSVVICILMVAETKGGVERYKSESEYLARLANLGHYALSEGFESNAWDNVRSDYPVINSLPSVTSFGITWEAAGLDIWNYPTSKVHGVTTNNNWAHTGSWGIYESHGGDSTPTTIRVSSPTSIFGIGGWFDTNPNGQSVGFLFENRASANEPGYVLPGLGAMYPGDNPSFGHQFVGIVDPSGFNSVILTGTLEINEEGILEGGTYFGADDFSIGLPLTADFDMNGVVDTLDLTDPVDGWEARYGVDLDGSNFLDWQRQFGMMVSPASAALSVPEPLSILLLLGLAASITMFRSRGHFVRFL
jgi:hypothetical protein